MAESYPMPPLVEDDPAEPLPADLVTPEDLFSAHPTRSIGILCARLAAFGLSLLDIARAMGLPPDELYVKYGAYIDAGQTQAITSVARKAYQLALDGDADMIKFILRTRGRGQWQERTQIDITAKTDPAKVEESAKAKLAALLENTPTASGETEAAEQWQYPPYNHYG